MNSSAYFYSEETPSECVMYIFLGGRLDLSTGAAYAVIVFITAVSIFTCPMTIALNVLVMIAVKTKPRLKTLSNISLTCLATTDEIMGVIGQPLFIAWTMSVVQGEAYCTLQKLARDVLRILGAASLFHLAMVNVERYLAIEHSLVYQTLVTKARFLRSSALLWIVAFLLTVPLSNIDNHIYITVSNITSSLCMAIIVFCQVVVYREIRRHEKEIAAQQVSMEARQKFLNDKKAFKVTTTVLFFLIVTYTPMIVVRILIVKSVINSVNVAYIAFFTATFVVLLNSFINPVIYCIRMRQFHVAFIEIVLRKSNTQAEDIDMRVFGTLNPVAPLEVERNMQEAQKNEQEDANNGNENNEHVNNSVSYNSNNMDDNNSRHHSSNNMDDNNSRHHSNNSDDINENNDDEHVSDNISNGNINMAITTTDTNAASILTT